jgi:hypothetical protein
MKNSGYRVKNLSDLGQTSRIRNTCSDYKALITCVMIDPGYRYGTSQRVYFQILIHPISNWIIRHLNIRFSAGYRIRVVDTDCRNRPDRYPFDFLTFQGHLNLSVLIKILKGTGTGT